MTALVAQTTILDGSNTKTIYVTQMTTIFVSALTVTELSVWAVTVFANDTAVATFTPVQSVAPSLIVVTLPGNEFLEPVPPVTTGITSTTKILPPLFSVSQTLTIEPQPTYPTITLPENLSITWSSGPPGPTCLGNRGHRSYILLPPSLCRGTCGIFGCGTGCGLSGCGVGCPECDSKPSGGEGANDSPPPPPPAPSPQTPTPSQISTTTTASTSSCSPGTAIDCNTVCYVMDSGCNTSCFSVTNACSATLATPFPIETPAVQFDLDESDDEVSSDASYIATLMNPILFSLDPVQLNGTLFFDGFSPTFTGASKSISPTQTTAPLSTVAVPASTTVPPTSTAASITPSPSCYVGANPDSGVSTLFSNCDGYPVTLPTLTSTASPYIPCAYTTLSALCTHQADPNNGNPSGYCYCPAYPSMLPVLTLTTSPYQPCGYTTLPPFPSMRPKSTSVAKTTSAAAENGGAPIEIMHVGWITTCNNEGKCESFWAVFASPFGTFYNACSTPGYWDKSPFPHGPDSPSFPVTLGPSDVAPYTGCSWKAQADTDVPGVFGCQGLNVPMRCTKDVSGYVECGQNTWWPAVVCEI